MGVRSAGTCCCPHGCRKPDGLAQAKRQLARESLGDAGKGHKRGKGETKLCFKCGQPGHIAAKCRSWRANGVGQDVGTGMPPCMRRASADPHAAPTGGVWVMDGRGYPPRHRRHHDRRHVLPGRNRRRFRADGRVGSELRFSKSRGAVERVRVRPSRSSEGN